jgi:hypothetical protein
MLEKHTKYCAAQEYIAESREEAGIHSKQKEKPVEERLIDEDTERTIVSVISAALVALPAGMLIGRLLPDIPTYTIYRYFQF